MTNERVQRQAPRLSVVMPVYNERRTIGEILCRVQDVAIEKEIVVVDDKSTDGTREFLEQLAANAGTTGSLAIPDAGRTLRTDNIRVFFQEVNQGKGAALRRGFREVRGDMVVVQDADLEYDPQDYRVLLAPIEQGLADVVYGSRFLGGPHRVLFFWHQMGNTVLTLLSNMATDVNLSDVWTCFKAFRREVLQGFTLRENRFGFEPEFTAKVARGRWRIYEVPVSYHGRTYSEGKKITWRDGIVAIWCILRYGLLRG